MKIGVFYVFSGRYCHSGPSSGDNSILTKLSVMPFCHGRTVLLDIQKHDEIILLCRYVFVYSISRFSVPLFNVRPSHFHSVNKFPNI